MLVRVRPANEREMEAGSGVYRKSVEVSGNALTYEGAKPFTFDGCCDEERPPPLAPPALVLVVQGCSGSSFVWRTLVHDLLPLHGVAVYSEHHGVRLDKELLNGRKGFTKLLADEGVSSTD